MVTIAEEAAAIVTVLSGMTDEQFSRYVKTLPTVGKSNRAVYALSDNLVLKVAPLAKCEYDCLSPEKLCDCGDLPACWRYHDIADLYCSCGLEEANKYRRGQNVAELSFWNRIKDNESVVMHFAAIFGAHADGLWLVAERVNPLDWDDRAPSSFHDTMRSIGIFDRQEANMGRRISDGTLLMLDYGVNEDWEEQVGERYWNNDRDGSDDYGYDCSCCRERSEYSERSF